MIMKERKTPQVVLILEMLLNRLHPQYPRRHEMEEELKRCLSGHKGEQSLDFYLNDLPQKDYLIFHNLRILQNNSYFEMDILILTQKYFLIIEVKNFSGTLFFDQDLYQLIRTINGLEETFADPISQVKRQFYCLRDWLKEHQYTNIPIESIVIVSNPQTQIKVSPGRSDIYKWVTHKTHLPERIRSYELKHKAERLSMKDLRKLSKLLLKKHTSPTPNILQKYQISIEDIIQGVACPKCSVIPMKRVKSKWVCTSCSLESKRAHVQALREYSLLISSTITNSQGRNFLKVSCRNTVRNLLLDLNISTSGRLRHTRYHLEFDDLRD
ncbi:nuclease-related domain-containing protein [Fictibacillus phosphorivorans]|uniref:nuclease-related domain-containing protein n=1 Tax=Fictibacillus phosphorivorans TaxID=1221500 RepID=UPI00203B52F1|nr:nuclease-related domain-containing protein [Fictibacillus phosphorivorans]MCM3718549.1 NERD domain-containing protein [Fictibacillus phosphorivorans]MCM3776095.1 NERD domain-containing protein [Fictibacillus phosphorivorans]